jgi:dihydroorotate dehydrogenase electron transfer subunit
MAAMNPGERISVEGPLGTGFSLGEGRPLFVGGGVGIAPLIFLTKRLQQKKPIVLIGGKNKEETFWTKYLEEYADKIYITTDDGSVGQKGFTIQAIPDLLENNSIDRIAVCGPMIMMKGIAEMAVRYKKECEVSMEKRMACGIGVCLGCTFEGKLTGKRRKVCSDGPVFPAREVF